VASNSLFSQIALLILREGTTFRELALNFDAQLHPLEAAWAYEIAIRDSSADVELFLNLAGFYFECLDFGFASFHIFQISSLMGLAKEP